ncbi:putative MtDNA inheritance protein Dml1 [Scedosporium apiospermum]|uniref:Putative MtDNA inheritance protein Dml1 n=1 Tax=Pseudallescheria apiosperma TaxID=563466 RepID=A0A084G6I9_PSEDA|nr:putative MtDNA inheritance protein Dml1 [Scedosporium apiospermum]KEZ42951.1 putative MtDNA inheritance protein Dml1 [Scedosporium apiospermum]
MVREIITVQLGELSNYVATHFWNTQESYFTYGDEEKSPVDHNIHWREGIGADGSETFLPRALIYDFRSSFGPLGRSNPLYENEEDDPNRHLWHGDASIHKQPLIPKSTYHAALDAGITPTLTSSAVRYWSDFTRPFFHPRSIVQLSDLEGTPSKKAATSEGKEDVGTTAPTLDTFDQGRELFKGIDAAEDVLDHHLRLFVEECDLLQGMQLVVGGEDGWSGFGAALLERVRDEYAKSCVWVWMPEGPSGGKKEKQILRLINKAKTLTETLPISTTLIPLSLPSATHLPSYSLNPSSPWHVSALLSTALESSTLPTRLHPFAQHPTPTTLSDLSAALNLQGRHNLARLQMGLGEGRGAADASEALDIDLFDLTGRTGREPKARGGAFGRVLVQRGDKRSEEQEDEVFKALFDEMNDNTPTSRFKSPLSYPLPDSFPPIYQTKSPSLTVDALLSTDAQVSVSAKTLRRLVLPVLRGDERENVGNALAEIAEEYHEGWSSGSDDDDY